MQRSSVHHRTTPARRGAAAVELALIMPLLMTISYFAIETGNALNVAQKLESVVRDGGRLACKDVEPSLLTGGQTANQKVVNDIKNMLKAEGYPITNVTVSILHADGAKVGQSFDLGNADNAYAMMKISVSLPYADVGIFPMRISRTLLMESSLVASRGRSTLNY